MLADVSTAAQLGGLAVAFVTLLGLLAAGFFVTQSKAKEVATETASTWRLNAEAEKAERVRLDELVSRTRDELEQLRRDAPDLKAIADRLQTLDGRMTAQTENARALAETIARIHQSQQLLVRAQGERRREYRGPIPIDPLTEGDDAPPLE